MRLAATTRGTLLAAQNIMLPIAPRRLVKAPWRARPADRGLLITGLIFILIGVIQVFFMNLVTGPLKDAALDRCAVAVPGTVTSKRIISNEKYGESAGMSNHPTQIEFVFEYPEGVTQSGRSRTRDTRLASSLAPGDAVQIEIDPDDPSRARLAGTRFAYGATWISLVVLGVLATGLFCAALGALRQRRLRELVRLGREVQATITDIIPQGRGSTAPMSKLRYELRTKYGYKVASTATVLSTNLPEALRIGGTISVLHDPTNPHNSIPWELLQLEIAGVQKAAGMTRTERHRG